MIECYPDLLRHLARRTGAVPDAEDLLHDLWIRLDRLPEKPVERPRAYLFRAAENMVLDLFRARSRGRTEALTEDIAAPDAGEDARLDSRRRLGILAETVGALPPRQREALLLYRVHGLPMDEVGRRMGISRSGVEKLLRKALISCRRQVFPDQVR
nr:sigma-70 family RNA polymerase sigma factor [Mangrovicoccus algicola]